MRVDRDRLIWLALCVVDRARRRMETHRGFPDVGVRLALAVLFDLGSSGDRERYDRLWRYLAGRGDTSINGQLQAMHDFRWVIQDVGIGDIEATFMAVWKAAANLLRAEGTTPPSGGLKG